MTGLEAARRLRSSPLLRRVAALCPAGTLLTGGSLRDRLLGLVTRDLDLVVTGDPAETARSLAAALDGAVIPLGKPPRRTWRVVAGNLQLDLWQPQGTLEEDIRRRDFTVNAIFWRFPDGPLLNLVGGLEDLAAGRIRVIAEANLRADPLRVLRALRLMATRPTLRLTADSEAALARTASLLPRAARERIHSELALLLAGPAVGRSLAVAARLGILAPLVPGWPTRGEVPVLAATASRLAQLVGSGRGSLRRGLQPLLPALLAAPAAGFPAAWDPAAAAAALTHLGLAPRLGSRLASAVAAGERFLTLPDLDGKEAREVAVDAGAQLPWALGWYLARRDLDPQAARTARALLEWYRRLDRRPAPMDGSEVAVLLGLPQGPLRARAVGLLRRGRALGAVRGRRQAAAWLRTHWPGVDDDR